MQQEFNIIAKRLLQVNTPPNELCLNYEKAVYEIGIEFTSYEQKIWKRMLHYPIFFKLYDSGFALINPNSLIRRRIFTALAILECTPHYTTYFLSTKITIWDILKLIVGIPIAILYGIIGGLLVYFKL